MDAEGEIHLVECPYQLRVFCPSSVIASQLFLVFNTHYINGCYFSQLHAVLDSMIKWKYWPGHRPGETCEYHFELEVFVFSLFVFLNQPPRQRQAVAGELREGLNAVQNIQQDLKHFSERQHKESPPLTFLLRRLLQLHYFPSKQSYDLQKKTFFLGHVVFSNRM